MSDSIWSSICSFDEHEDNVYGPPLAYLGAEHHPFPTDYRGGVVDVSEIAEWQSCLDPTRFLRVVVVSPDEEQAAGAVLDVVQVARLHERLGRWLGGPNRPITAEDLT